MANVKITALTNLAGTDAEDRDVFVIDDVSATETKKITVANVIAFTGNAHLVGSNLDSFATGANAEDTALQARITANADLSASNDFVTYTRLQANIDLVQDNVAGLTSELTIRGDNATDDTVTLGSETLTFLGDTGLTSTVSANAVTFDLDDTAVTAGLYGGKIGTVSNVPVITIDAQGRITSASNSEVAVDLSTLESNVNTVSSNVDAVQARLTTNVTAFTNEDTALQARIAANTLTAASNDFVTFTRLNANINVVQDNVVASEANVVLVRSNIDSFASTTNTTIDTLSTNLTANLVQATANTDAVETRRADNVFFTLNLTGQPQANIILNDANVEPTSNNTYSLGAPDKVWKDVFIGPGSLKIGDVTISALGKEGITITGASGDQANVTTPNQGGVSNVSAELEGLQSRLTTNVTAFTNEDTALQSRLATNVTAFTNEDTALQARLATNVTAFTNEDTALQARITANNQTAASNDFITFTRLNANVDIVQDNVATNATDIAAVEARRAANIVGAVSTITTSDLTASRAVVSDGSGKLAVSDVTSTEIGHLDGVTSAIQTQLDAVEARRAANLVSATFTGEVSMSDDLIVTGNLTVNGDTTTVNSENKVIQDRFIMLANSVSGAPSADVGILFNRGTSGNAALFYDESAKFFTLSETRDPDTNVAISPTGAANLSVGQFTASSVAFDGADLSTAITDNVSTLNTSIAAVETRRTNNIAGAISTVLTSDLTASRALVAGTGGKIEVSDVTSTELGYLDGVTSAIQTQLDAKQATITGAATTIDDTNLTASRALVSDGSGKVAVSAVTATELGHLDGVTSAIQTQLDAKSTTSNAAALAAEDVALQSRLATNVTAFTNEDTALQARITANNTLTSAVETRRTQNIAGAVSSITTSDLTASRAMVTNGSGKVAVSAVTATELGYLDGVSSAIQTQLDAKQATITGAATTIDDTNLTASRALASDGSGKVAVSAVTSTELGYLDGVTSAIQTQLDAKQATITGAATTIDDTNLTASRALVSDGSGKVAVSDITSTELAFLDGLDQNLNSNLVALAAGIAASATGIFPTGDYGLLDAANAATDAFGFAVADLTIFDMSDTPAGELDAQDLGALT